MRDELKRSEAARMERIVASPQWNGSSFGNTLPQVEPPMLTTIGKMLTASKRFRSPAGALPLLQRTGTEFGALNPQETRMTWLGHSTSLIEMGGARLLLDPVFGERASPFSWLGPKRFHPPPLPLDELPALDAVIISHDHYDHLDYPTIRRLIPLSVPFITSLGVGRHLEKWGVEPSRIIELDWWEETRVRDVTITATPARHFSGRSMTDRERTLWSGIVMRSADHSLYFTGDTALFPDFATIGERLGPFDLVLMEAGAYNPLWRDVHIGPEQAILAAQMCRAKAVVPVHWGTFDLALHNWTEPVERMLQAARAKSIPLATPRLGESFVLGEELPTGRWWPEVEYQSAGDAPLISSHLPDELRLAVEALSGI